MRRVLIATFAALGLVSCASKSRPLVERFTNSDCEAMAKSLKIDDPLDSLDLMSSLVYKRCDAEAIALGGRIRGKYREKNFSVTREAMSVFVPEDKLSEYVLESHERVYLSVLIALSHFNLGQRESAAVELRQAQVQSQAEIYNFGEDPLNAMLIAAAWENLSDAETARPFWVRVKELSSTNASIASFVDARLLAIDSAGGPVPPAQRWRIHWIGRFPELDYAIELAANSSYYRIHAKTGSIGNCVSATGARLSAEPWVAKFARRYDSEYHPDMNTKSWIRTPIALLYGAATVTTGVALGVAGCALGANCAEALKGGAKVASKSGDVVSGMLKPDLRHWKTVPGALLITRAEENTAEACWNDLEPSTRSASFEITRIRRTPALHK